MKKLMMALAVVAIASAAQAELLATWTFPVGGASSMAANGSAANIGQVTFGELTRVNLGVSSTVAGQFAANNWVAPANGISLSVTVASGYEIASATIGVGGLNGSGTGAATLQWALNGTDVGTAWTVAFASASSVYADVAVGTIDAGVNTLFLRSTGGSVNTPTAAPAAAGSSRLLNSMTMGGDIQAAIPEPATMSLLGLGALAMALRRKMKK